MSRPIPQHAVHKGLAPRTEPVPLPGNAKHRRHDWHRPRHDWHRPRQDWHRPRRDWHRRRSRRNRTGSTAPSPGRHRPGNATSPGRTGSGRDQPGTPPAQRRHEPGTPPAPNAAPGPPAAAPTGRARCRAPAPAPYPSPHSLPPRLPPFHAAAGHGTDPPGGDSAADQRGARLALAHRHRRKRCLPRPERPPTVSGLTGRIRLRCVVLTRLCSGHPNPFRCRIRATGRLETGALTENPIASQRERDGPTGAIPSPAPRVPQTNGTRPIPAPGFWGLSAGPSPDYCVGEPDGRRPRESWQLESHTPNRSRNVG